MESKKLKNAQTLIRTAYGYNNFLNHEYYVPGQIGTTYQLDGNGSREEYKNLIITHAILLLSVFKERLLKKEDDSLKLKISDPVFTTLMGNLIQPDGTKYKIGELSFEEKIDVLETLRNKLLHGDYYIEKDNIILNNKGITGSITIEELYRMSTLLLPVEKFKLTGPNIRPIISTTKQNIEKENRMQSLKQLRTYMSGVNYYRFIDIPEPGFERTLEYGQGLDQFFEIMWNIKSTHPHLEFEQIFNSIYPAYRPALKKLHIQLSYEKISVPDTEYYNRIETFFLKNKKQLFNQLSPLERRLIMQKIATAILNEKDDDDIIIANAIYNSMNVIKAYAEHKDVYADVSFLQQHSMMYLDEITVAGLMNAFYCIYHYGLDEIYSKQGGTSLKDIASGECLNFARLKLDWFDDDDMTIDVSFADFPNQLEALRKAPIDLAARTEIAKRNLEGYRRSSAKKTEAKEQQLMDAVTACEQAEKDAKELYENAKRFMDKDFNNHVKNFNIIAHIRNSFAHGNVRIKPYVKGDTLKDQLITMQDIYNGALTYYLTIRYDDFYQLVMPPNINIMMDFIDTKIEKTKEKKSSTLTKSKK